MTSTTPFPSFSSADHPQLRFSAYLNKLLDEAVNASSRIDGIAGFLLSPAVFLVRFGHAYEFPAERVPQPEAVPAAPWNAWRYHEDLRLATDNNIRDFRTKFLAGLDAPTLKLFEDVVGGNRTRTLEWMVARMTARFGTVSSTQLESFEKLLLEPFIVGESMLAFISQHRDVHLTCAAQQQPLSEAIKVRYLTNSLKPSCRFGTFLEAYNLRHPTIAEQTFDNLNTELTAYESTMDKEATARSLGYAGSAIDIDAAIAAAIEKALSPATMALLAAATIKPSSSTERTSQAPKYYCWTHGPNNTHNGDQCQRQATGHVASATARDEKGGNSTVFKSWHKRKEA